MNKKKKRTPKIQKIPKESQTSHYQINSKVILHQIQELEEEYQMRLRNPSIVR